MGNAIFAFGTTLKWNTSHVVAELTDVSGPNIKVASIDVTTHGSTSGWREKLAGLKDGGQVTIKGNFYPGDTAGQKAFVDDMIAGTSRTAVITPPTAAPCTFTFTAFGVDFKLDSPVAGSLGFTATLEITGVPVFAVTASDDITSISGHEETGTGVLDFVPNSDGAVYEYNVLVDTGSDYITLKVVHAGTITVTALGATSTLATNTESGAITIDAADSVTDVVVNVKDSGKVAKNYTIHVARP